MPKATAVWLVENSTLTFEQIASFCGIHQLEVQAIADGDVAIGMQGLDPVANGELTQEEIDRCGADPDARLVPAKPRVEVPKARKKGARYTPVSKRQDRPDAISWLLKNYPELSDAQVSRLIGTTKPTINSVRERTHWNAQNIKPQNPVTLGLCTTENLEKQVAVARARAGTVHAPRAEPVPSVQPAASVRPAPKPKPEPISAETLFPNAPKPEEKKEEPLVDPFAPAAPAPETTKTPE